MSLFFSALWLFVWNSFDNERHRLEFAVPFVANS